MAYKVVEAEWLSRHVANAKFVLLEYGVKDEEYGIQDLRTLLADYGFSYTAQEVTQIRNQLAIEGVLEEV